MCKHFPARSLNFLLLIIKQFIWSIATQIPDSSFLGGLLMFPFIIYIKSLVKLWGTDIRTCNRSQGCAAELKWEIPAPKSSPHLRQRQNIHTRARISPLGLGQWETQSLATNREGCEGFKVSNEAEQRHERNKGSSRHYNLLMILAWLLQCFVLAEPSPGSSEPCTSLGRADVEVMWWFTDKVCLIK